MALIGVKRVLARGQGVRAGYFNFGAPISAWVAAKSALRADSAYARVMVIGDSLTAGYSGSTSTDNRPTAWPVALAGLIANGGLPSAGQSVFGSSSMPGGAAANDSRISLSGSWTTSGSTAGGAAFLANGAGTFAITPPGNWSSADIYTQSTAGSKFNWNVDGGSNTLISMATAITKYTVTAGSLGAHTLNILWNAGNVYVLGWAFYDGSGKSVLVCNAGIHGCVASTWGAAPKNGIGAFAPHLSLICLTINDASIPTAEATYKSAYQSIIDKCKETGDAVIIVAPPANPTWHSLSLQATFRQYNYDLAVSNNLRLIDLLKLWPAYDAGVELGYYGDAVVHLTPTGASKFAADVYASRLFS